MLSASCSPSSLSISGFQEVSRPKSKMEDLTKQFEHYNSLLLEQLHAFKNKGRELAEKSEISLERGIIDQQETPSTEVLNGFKEISNSLNDLGEQNYADQVMTYGHSTYKLLNAYKKLESREVNPLVPYREIASASASLSALTFQKMPEPVRIGFFKSFHRACNDLFSQISNIHRDMLKGFTFLKDQVDVLHSNMMRGFLFLEKQIQDVAIPVFYSLSKIEKELKQLQEINAKIDVVLLSDFSKSCNFVECYQDRSGSQPIEKSDLEFHARAFENVLLGVSPPFYTLNGALCEDYQASGVIRTVRSARADTIVGFLVSYAEKVLKVPFPASFPAANIPNFSIFSLGLERYLTLRKMGTNVDFDVQGIQINKILEIGTHVLSTIQHVQSNRLIFEKLFASYQQKLTKIKELIKKVSDDKIEKVLKELTDLSTRENTAIVSSKQTCSSGNITACRAAHHGPWQYLHESWHCAFICEIMGDLRDPSQRKLSIKLNTIVSMGQNWDSAYTKELSDIAQAEAVSKLKHGIDIQAHLTSLIEKVCCAPIINFCVPTSGQIAPVKNPHLYYDTTLKFIPLALSSLPLTPENRISLFNTPKECFLAEQMGLGKLEYSYSITSAPYDENVDFVPIKFTVTAYFKVFQSQASLLVNKFTFDGTPVNSENPCLDWSRQLSFRDRGAVMLKQCWSRGSNFTRDESLTATIAGNKETLFKLIAESLVSFRKQAISELYNPPLSAEYLNLLEELQSDYLLLQAFGEIAGFKEDEIQALVTLPNGDSIKRHQQNYLQQPKNETDPLFPMFGEVERISSRILERFPEEYQIESEILKNPLATLIQNQLSRLATFGLSFLEDYSIKVKRIAAAQLKEKEKNSEKDKEIAELRRALEKHQRDSSEREHKLELSYTKLATKVTELESLNAALLEQAQTMNQLMQKIVVKKKKKKSPKKVAVQSLSK